MPTPTEEILQYYSFPFTFREDQVETIDKLCSWDRNGCFYPVGGGKTAIATAVAFYFGIHDLTDQIIVFCPPILLKQWADWLESFTGLSICRYFGNPAKRAKLSLDTDCVVTTTGLFKNDFEKFMDFFGPRRVFTIIDEAVVIRNPGTLAFKAVRDFMETGQKQISLLTGTEISAPFQAYGYIKLITPDIYRDYRYFTLLHITKLDQYKTPSEYKNLDYLAESLLQQAVRKEADEILDLPDCNFVPVIYELAPNHMKLYNKVVEELLVTLDDGTVLNALIPQRLRMTSQRVIMMPSEFEGMNIKPAGFQLINEMAMELGQEKFMIFGQFNTSNEAIYEHCKKLGLEPALVYGGPRRTAKKNQKDVDRFKTDPKCRALVCNPKSCGVGVDGIQHICRAQLFMELPPFSDFDQAVGRVKREGQKRKCIIKIAIAEGTIQVDLKRKALKKEALAKKVVPTKAQLREALHGG